MLGFSARATAEAGLEGDAGAAHDAYVLAAQSGQGLGSEVSQSLMYRDYFHLATLARKDDWSDETPILPSAIPQPRLKLVGLHLRDLRAIRRFDLPEEGIAWQGKSPDLMLIGGLNGSGKTTLLNFITDSLELFASPPMHAVQPSFSRYLAAGEAWADFEFESYEFLPTKIRFLVGTEDFINQNFTENCWWIRKINDGACVHGQHLGSGLNTISSAWHHYQAVTVPSLVFLPSEYRNLMVPDESFKAAGKLENYAHFVSRWKPPEKWKDSLEAILYGLRWEDLNAKEEGRVSESGRFAAYADAFRRFTGEAKSLRFERGELVVRLAGEEGTHGLKELSSGERQALLMCGELLRRWRPGSLILIDEPELHMHGRWQTELLRALKFWLAERGGQVILATQSPISRTSRFGARSPPRNGVAVMDAKAVADQISSDLYRAAAGRVIYLEGKTDPAVLSGLLGLSVPHGDEFIHQGTLVRGLSAKAGSGNKEVRRLVEVAQQIRLGRKVFGIVDGDGEDLSNLQTQFDSPHAGPLFAWKAYSIECLLAHLPSWPISPGWGSIPNWHVELAWYAPYVAINTLYRNLRFHLKVLGLTAYSKPENGKPLKTAGDVSTFLQAEPGRLSSFDVASEFAKHVAAFEAALARSHRDALVSMDGKWLLTDFLNRRSGSSRSGENWRSDWILHAESVGGLLEVRDLWQRITGSPP